MASTSSKPRSTVRRASEKDLVSKSNSADFPPSSGGQLDEDSRYVVVVMGVEKDMEPTEPMALGETQSYGYGHMNSSPKAVRGYKVYKYVEDEDIEDDDDEDADDEVNPHLGELVFCKTV